MPVHNQLLFDASAQGPGPQIPSPQVLAGLGAFTPVDVGVPPQVATALSNAGQAVPPSVTGVAIVDTGATLTCVHEPELVTLGLHPVGTITSLTANGPAQTPLYVARLIFPTFGWTVDLTVVGVDLSGQQVATDPPQTVIALLGRNLLQNAVLVWNGPGGIWTLAH